MSHQKTALLLKRPNDQGEMSSVESIVCQKIECRAHLGLSKYGTSMERKDLTKIEWLRHAQAEAMDLAVYLEKLIQQEQDAPTK
jgi:hypothetical protein